MKKFLAFVLSAVMVAAFAGCGSESSSESGSSEGSVSSEASATEAPATQETLAANVKKQLDDKLKTEGFKGVVQITKGGEPIYQYANGDDDNGKPLTIDASLPIGSTSKQFCAAAVMKLCDDRKLSVDDTIDKFFPDYKYGKKMTVKDLLNMSSGLPNYLELIDPSMMVTNEADNVNTIKKTMFNEELHFEPGDDYEYSNSNYFLLADIVEQISGVPYHEFLRKYFFEPLDMTSTGFTDEATSDHEWTSALSTAELKNEDFFTPGLTKGAGDVISNAADMDKWMRGLSGGKIISSDAFRQMTENINPNSAEDYCYGLWHMVFDGVGHVGQIPPHFGAVDYLNPERDVYLFAASNTMSGMSYVQELPQALLSILFENEANA